MCGQKAITGVNLFDQLPGISGARQYLCRASVCSPTFIGAGFSLESCQGTGERSHLPGEYRLGTWPGVAGIKQPRYALGPARVDRGSSI